MATEKHRFARWPFAKTLAAALLVLLAVGGPVDTRANGDARTLTFFHTHTKETATVTFRQDGRYDEKALAQLNWFLRDWRSNEPTKMDPRLFDILWEMQQEIGSQAAIHVISAYRSPATNGALRRRSGGVADNSLHMAGKAIDIRIPGIDTSRLRATAMQVQYGGVGYYPSSDFVHVDTGSVRAWPRMSQEQLARLFPTGKTVHLPANGKPLPGYEEARAEILARNTMLASAGTLPGAKTRDRPSPARQDTITTASIGPLTLPASPDKALVRNEPAYARALFTPPDRTASMLSSPLMHMSVVADAPPGTAAVTLPAVVVAMRFTRGDPVGLMNTRFTGPAVQPLPVLR